MKRLLVLLAILAMVSGGAAAAWVFYLRPLLTDPAAAEGQGEAVAHPEFVTIENLVMPVVYESRVTYHLTLTLTLEVPSEAAAIEIKRNRARLRDVVVTELHALFARRFVQEDGLTGPLVQRRLLQVVRERFGASAVRGLTLREVDRRVPSPVT